MRKVVKRSSLSHEDLPEEFVLHVNDPGGYMPTFPPRLFAGRSSGRRPVRPLRAPGPGGLQREESASGAQAKGSGLGGLI